MPTHSKISFWHHRKDALEGCWHDVIQCTHDDICNDCQQEIARRNRVLNLKDDNDSLAERLAHPKFKT
eukprot:1396738-Karenia_brevis.AAC.1